MKVFNKVFSWIDELVLTLGEHKLLRRLAPQCTKDF